MVRRSLGLILAAALIAASVSHASAAKPPSQLRGVLLDADGLPASGYQLALMSEEGDLFLASPSGADGAFEALGLPAGKYRLVAYSPDGAEFAVVSGELSLEPGQVLRLELRLVSGGVPPGRDPESLLASPVDSSSSWLAGVWNKGAAGKAGIIVVSAAVAYGLVALFESDDEEPRRDDASPSAP